MVPRASGSQRVSAGESQPNVRKANEMELRTRPREATLEKALRENLIEAYFSVFQASYYSM